MVGQKCALAIFVPGELAGKLHPMRVVHAPTVDGALKLATPGS